jgi:hypothetical protein
VFKSGDRVRVGFCRPIKTAWVRAGLVGEFVEYTKPHGYARVALDGYGEALVHPEELEPEDA